MTTSTFPEEARLFLSENIVCPGADTIISLILLIGTAAVAVIAYWLTKLLLYGVERIVYHSPTDWDNDLIDSNLLKAVSQLSPAFAVSYILPELFGWSPASFYWLSALTKLYIIWAAVRVITILLGNLYTALARRPKLKYYAVKGIFQMVKLIIIAVGVIIGLSILVGRSPVAIITALGASAAILMLVFKDTILGLVASVQLTANNMVHRGDWIAADKHGANGEVVDISLTTVKVKNWDNSVTTIPPYSLISDSFRNYEPMRTSGGRRVDRSIYIDINSVRFLEPEEVNTLANEGWLEGIEPAAGKVVNLGLLRVYLERMLGSDSRVNADMLIMVRQLEPTQAGLPLQLYFFTKTTEWKTFERHQSEIFDTVYAITRRFGLSIYQAPAGTDLARAKS